MAINKITAPIQPPASDADWSNTQDLIEALALGIEGPLRIVGSNVVRGAVFNIGGSVYIADADTAITGTASKYVKITPSGASATASYVASLTGVTWNSTYNGYYDGSGNLYIFDELLAYTMGVISTVYGNRNFNPSTMDRLGLGPGSNAGTSGTALGVNSDASGASSTSVGSGNISSGDNSIAAGFQNVSSGTGSAAVGRSNEATGAQSTASGYNNTASAPASNVFGSNSEASGTYAGAYGHGNTASGDNSFAAGSNQTCDTAWETAINDIRYVRFPAGTSHATIFNKLFSLVGTSTPIVVERTVAVFGHCGTGPVNFIIMIITPSPEMRLAVYGGATRLTVRASETTTYTSVPIKLCFLTGYGS